MSNKYPPDPDYEKNLKAKKTELAKLHIEYASEFLKLIIGKSSAETLMAIENQILIVKSQPVRKYIYPSGGIVHKTK